MLLVAAGVVAFYWFAAVGRRALRALAVAAGLVAGRGRVPDHAPRVAQTREFLSESRFELRKVVWPTRQEAMRTTWVVMIVVVDPEPDPGRLRLWSIQCR